MEANRAVLEILESIHRKNIEILEKQNEESIQQNEEVLKLYQYYYITDMRIQNAIDILKLTT